MSFTEVNTVMPALVLGAGGGEFAVGVLTGIMIGLPLVSQLVFAGFLQTRRRKKPFLLLGINLRVVALAAAAGGIWLFGTDSAIIPVVFTAMAVFALSGAFAGVSYTELVGKLVETARRRKFFVGRQVATTLGLLVSAVATRLFLGATEFPQGYILLFGLASTFLLIGTTGFWMLREPVDNSAEYTGIDAQRERPERHGAGVLAAIQEMPGIVGKDGNMRALILAANLAAPGFTAIPLLTALAHKTYLLDTTGVGTFVMVQITGMLGASFLWTRLIKRGGFRLVLRVELVLMALLFPLALVASKWAPLSIYTLLYLLAGSVISAHKIGMEAVLVQISPDNSRALYAGVFGAANIGAALMPLVTGLLVGKLGFGIVFPGAAAAALLALFPVRKLWCGDWFRDHPS